MKKLKEWFVLRWRLWRVCRRLEIRPYRWQREYALGKSYKLMTERGCGKSTAVMLYGLIRNITAPLGIALLARVDPDVGRDYGRGIWFAREYIEMARRAGLDHLPKVNDVGSMLIERNKHLM